MRKIKIKYLVIFLIIAFVSLTSFEIYADLYGYPWKHIEVKREAVDYMKNKYNMDVKVEKSTFNPKFDYYLVKVFDVNDEEKNIINVEKQKFHVNGQYKGERLEDNYSKIYWESRLMNELQTRYAKFFMLPDQDSIHTDIAYFTTPLEEGVSSIKDENGFFIPLKPDNNCILDVDLNTEDFSDEFLKELLLVIKDLENTLLKVDLVITGKSKGKITENNFKRTKLLDLHYEKFKDIKSVEDLKNEVRDF